MVKLITVESRHAPCVKSDVARKREVEQKLDQKIKKLGFKNPQISKVEFEEYSGEFYDRTTLSVLVFSP